jgi:hypothetical protein
MLGNVKTSPSSLYQCNGSAAVMSFNSTLVNRIPTLKLISLFLHSRQIIQTCMTHSQYSVLSTSTPNDDEEKVSNFDGKLTRLVAQHFITYTAHDEIF